jgi:hypothetical protein
VPSKMRSRRFFVFTFAVTSLFLGCSPRVESLSDPGRLMKSDRISNQKKSFSNEDLRSPEIEGMIRSSIDPERARWIDRMARKVRNGAGLRPNDPLGKWLEGSDEAVMKAILQSPEFEDGLLDFLLYFYGFKPAVLKEEEHSNTDGYAEEVFTYSQAIAALQSYFSQSGSSDFFERVTQFSAPIYLRPLTKVLRKGDTLPGKTLAENRAAIVPQLFTFLDASIDLFSKPMSEENLRTACQEFLFGKTGVSGYFDYFYRMGWGTFTNHTFMKTFWTGTLYEQCVFSPMDGISNVFVKNEVIRLRALSLKMMEIQPDLEPSVYTLNSMKDLRRVPVDWVAGDLPSLGVYLDLDTIPNSTTNLNRKRAAFILKRYFCDDLNPIGVQIPNSHSDDQHGSDPSCYSCHFKLDPMAGFFRNLGIYFFDYSQREKIIFSDETRLNRETYLNNWKNPPGSPRVWNVGYIRSSVKEDLNAYGESISDLERILSEAREVKECFVRRAYQYFVDENQMVSPAFIENLTAKFIEESKAEHSAAAFEKLAQRLLSSQGFRASNRISNQCYDRAPGENPNLNLSCEVASTFEKNCVRCHGGLDPAGGLNLTKMIDLEDGTMNFPHVSEGGNQYPRAHTLTQIADRLGSSDPQKRMPLRQEISSVDRDRLYVWVQKQSEKRPARGVVR